MSGFGLGFLDYQPDDDDEEIDRSNPEEWPEFDWTPNDGDADDAPPEVRSAARRAREARVALAEAEAAVAAAKVRAGRDDVAGAENEKTILRRTPPRTLRTPPSTPPREKAVRDSKASLRGSTSGADAARASPPRPRSAPAEAVPSSDARSRRSRSRQRQQPVGGRKGCTIWR